MTLGIEDRSLFRKPFGIVFCYGLNRPRQDRHLGLNRQPISGAAAVDQKKFSFKRTKKKKKKKKKTQKKKKKKKKKKKQQSEVVRDMQ